MGNSNSSPLQHCLNGVFANTPARVSYPSNPFYQLDYVKPYNLDIPINPIAVTRPGDSQQIADVVQCAVAAGAKVQARSGGHSYGNYGNLGPSGRENQPLTTHRSWWGRWCCGSRSLQLQAVLHGQVIVASYDRIRHPSGGRHQEAP